MNRIVEMLSDGFAASGVTGQEYITANITLLAVNMELHTNILHNDSSLHDLYLKYITATET